MGYKRSRQQGSVVVMMALSMAVLVAAVGLVVDTGVTYMVRDKLNAATDAASLAAARAVSQGKDEATQRANAQAAAIRFFNANYPTNYMGSTAKLNAPSVVFNNGMVTVSVSASATLPVSFLGLLGVSPLTPAVASQAVRKDLDMAVVLDTSGSLYNQGNNVIASAKTFLNQFNADQDRVGLIHFSYGAVIDDPIRPVARGFDRASMVRHINDFDFSGSTASPEGMFWARQQLNSVPTSNNNRSNLRVIVFFSDGAPNSFASYLTWKTPTDCTKAGVITTDDDSSGTPGGMYRTDVQSAVLTEQRCNPNYAYGYDRYGRYYYDLDDKASTLPDWYNGHNLESKPNDINAREFAVVTDTPRKVTNAVTFTNINRAARNIVEAMARKSQDEGIYVFTLGLGAALKSGTGVDGEKGEDTLKCMANSTDAPARCFNAAKPVGLYCYAATTSDLTPCFSKLASAIMRISR
ncbi:Flp pilus assembly protein TadG [Duganella sp. 3397]|uniref:VWA domain-containing protein n=1 Tax=Duganella sp. 3397 TaxID=2817732 RepID=UPI0028676764|nr:VWA domain-containing protein [Duganella sp. 3397]MDR7052200.1 Flp pilus assembly protein TadG [Duganella sp. 3397]